MLAGVMGEDFALFYREVYLRRLYWMSNSCDGDFQYWRKAVDGKSYHKKRVDRKVDILSRENREFEGKADRDSA
jgi:hypothetical protein